MGATLGELRAAMNRLKGTLRSQMKMMEADLRKDPFPKLSLLRELGNAETEWNKVQDCYDHILTMTGDKQAEDDHLAYEELQTCYCNLNEQVMDALEEHQEEEEACERDRLKVSKVRQLGDRWEAAYLHIDTVLGELKTLLGGENIDDVELLGVISA